MFRFFEFKFFEFEFFEAILFKRDVFEKYHNISPPRYFVYRWVGLGNFVIF